MRPSPSTDRPLPWRVLAPLALLFVVGVPRVAVLVELRANSPSFHQPEGGDSIFYDLVARGAHSSRRAYFHSPLYQGFLTTAYATIGRHLTAVRVIQHLLGLASVLLIYLITLRLGGARWVAVVAGLLYGLLGPPIFYESQLLVDGILPLLVLLALWATLRFAARPSSGAALLLGAAIGVGALGRPVVLAWLPLLGLWLALRGPSGRTRWAHGALILAGTVIAILPVTVRNYVVERDLVLITSNAGLNLYIGNNPEARGTYAMPQEMDFRPGDPADDFMGLSVGRGALGRDPTSSELSRYWAGRAGQFVRDRPLAAARLLLTKTTLLLSNHEAPQLYHYGAYRELSPTLRWLPTAGVLLVPSLVGLALWLAQRGGGAGHRLTALLVLSYGLSFLPFFVQGRFRVAWLALLAPFGAWALAALVHALRGRAIRRTAFLGVGLLVASLVSFALPVPEEGPSVQYQHFGWATFRQHRLVEAERWFKRALEANPGSVRALEGYAIVLSRTGRPAQAEQLLQRAAQVQPASARTLANLGSIQAMRGELDAAIQSLRRAIALQPRMAEAHINLGQLLERKGDARAALVHYRQGLAAAPTGAAWIRSVEQRVARLAGAVGP